MQIKGKATSPRITHTFHCYTADVKVTPTMQVLGDKPYMVQIIPNSALLPVETLVVVDVYPFNAANEGLDQYKEKYCLPLTEVWTL